MTARQRRARANPWGKFFWNDWETDPSLRLCSLAAQGLWMRLLCLAAKSTKPGYVLVNGRAPSVDDLAVLVGRPAEELSPLLDELESNGVFSRDRHGVILSRRMVRDEKRSQEGRKHVRKRWAEASENKEENAAPNREATRGPTPQKPEAISHKPEREVLPTVGLPPKDPPADDGFEAWYAEYPHKVGKGAAVRAWPKARKKAGLPELLTGLRHYVATKPPDRPWCNPATWLNEERWLDLEGPVAASRGPPGRGTAVMDAFDEIGRRARHEPPPYARHDMFDTGRHD